MKVLNSFLVGIFFVTLNCSRKSLQSEEKSQKSGDEIKVSSPLFCELNDKTRKLSYIDQPFVHVASLKGQNILMFGYLKIDLSFSAFEGLYKGTGKKFVKAPAQKLNLVMNPPKDLREKIQASLKDVSCAQDLEKVLLSIVPRLQNIVYIQSEVPEVEVMVGSDSTSFCDLSVETVNVDVSKFASAHFSAKSEQENWQGAFGKFFTENVAEKLKNFAVLTGTEKLATDFVLSQTKEIFQKDMLIGVKKSLGCRK